MTKLIELMLVISSFGLITNTYSALVTINTVIKSTQNETVIEKKDTIIEYETKSFDDFLEKLSFRESSNNWKAINRFGYMGKYQIGKLALKDIGMDSINSDDFIKNPNIFPEYLQDIAIKKYILKNKKYLKNCIACYKNRVVNNILITESSIIGAAHLVGQKNVKEWLKCNGHIKKVDGNGVTIESYLKLFSGYKIS